MKQRKMTDRLEAVFSIIPHAEAIADVGTDHGYLAVELVARGKADRVIAGDVNKGPLATAARYIASRNLDKLVECRLGDGLRVTEKGELKGAVICGMGGFLMRDIVAGGPEALDFYVLQPQNGQAELRQYMVDKGYRIVKDIVMTDMGKMYQAFLAIRQDCLADYVKANAFLENLPVQDVYETLDRASVLWEAGALAQEEALWKDHVEHLIYQRQCALDGMGADLAHTDKYKNLEAAVKELQALLANNK